MKAKTRLIAIAAAAVLSGANALTDDEISELLKTYDDVLVQADTGKADSSFANGEHWYGKAIPESGKKYYVPSGMCINDPGGAASYTFPGTLVLSGYIQALCAGGQTLTYQPLRLLNGSEYRFSSFNKVAGDIYVDSTEENPAVFRILHHNSENNFTLNVKFHGGENNVLTFARSGDPTANSFIPGPRIILGGKFDDYYGSLVICSNAMVKSALGNWGNAKIKVEREGYLYLDFTKEFAKMRSLSLEDGARLQISPNWELREDAAPLYITEELRIGNDVKLDNFVKFALPTSSTYKIALARLSDEAYAKGVQLPERIELPKRIFGEFPKNPRLEIADGADGVKTLYIVYDPVLTVIKYKDSKPSGIGAFSPGSDDFWDPAGIPDCNTNADILVAAASILWSSGDASWPNATFTLVKTAYIQNSSLYANFDLCPGSSMMSYGNSLPVSHNGSMRVLPGSSPVSYTIFNNKTANIHSTISGSGDFRFVTWHIGGTFCLFGTNDNFTGGMRFYVNKSQVNAEEVNVSKLRLYDSRNLGGVYTGKDNWKAVSFEDGFKVHVESSDIELVEPTRGVAVVGSAEFIVGEGRNFTVGSGLTLAGVLTKSGTGTLTLAGGTKFIDGNDETAPAADINRLVVAGGALRIAATNALDGVQTELADGCSIVLDVAPSADGMAEWGIVCKKWATPFVSSSAIDVVFEDPSLAFALRPLGYALAICTVPEQTASTLDFKLGRVRGMNVSLVRRGNADGTVTFLAGFEPKGMIMLVR